ncbi:MAG TPA: hypothetical protein PKI14_18565 [Fervidobacterium sp.]|nr:hypothetical protein [Fervidobacterium sp.]
MAEGWDTGLEIKKSNRLTCDYNKASISGAASYPQEASTACWRELVALTIPRINLKASSIRDQITTNSFHRTKFWNRTLIIRL